MAELKPGWRRVKFGDVVRLNKETCKDPAAEGIERVIGLEHLEPGDLQIRSWGNVTDGTKFTNRVQPGQVLFGKRRAYQRKVAVADFKAICSGDIYVLESADTERLLPGLLPFICQSESFFEHAVGTSAGSLSPRTNWKSLSGYEFALPSLEEQRQILKTLIAANSITSAYASASEEARRLEASWLKSMFSVAGRWPQCPIGLAGDLQLGLKKERDYDMCLDPKPFLRVANIGDGELLLEDVRSMDFPGHRFERHRLKAGDVLLTEGDITSPINVGRAAIFMGEIEDCCIQNTLFRFRPYSGLDPLYALAAFRYMRASGGFLQAAMTTTVTHLVDSRLRKLSMPIPGPSLQKEIGERLQELFAVRREADRRRLRSRNLASLISKSMWSSSVH